MSLLSWTHAQRDGALMLNSSMLNGTDQQLEVPISRVANGAREGQARGPRPGAAAKGAWQLDSHA
eukprot:570927-Prymnesium_polylepis.1